MNTTRGVPGPDRSLDRVVRSASAILSESIERDTGHARINVSSDPSAFVIRVILRARTRYWLVDRGNLLRQGAGRGAGRDSRIATRQRDDHRFARSRVECQKFA